MSAEVSAKKKRPIKLRDWVIVDATGHKETLKLDIYEITRRVQISIRDLRIFDRDSSYPCTIMGRERAILLNLDYIKMIITADEVLFPDWMDNHHLQRFQQEFMAKMSGAETDSDEKDESTFEFRALDLALESVSNFLKQETQNLHNDVYGVLGEYNSRVSSLLLNLIPFKKREIHLLTARIQKVRDEIKRLAENDDALVGLYLSRKLAPISSTSSKPILNRRSSTKGSKFSRRKRGSFTAVRVVDNDVEELQMFFEQYYCEIDILKYVVSEIQNCIADAEIYLDVKLNYLQNQLIKFQIIIISVSFCISIYSLVPGILSMNIPHPWINKENMFIWVVIVTGAVCTLLFVIIVWYVRFNKLV